MMHFAGDILLAMAWFAAFGIDVNWMEKHNGCTNGAFRWGGMWRGGRCGKWKALQSFSFISGCFWLVSAVLSLWVEKKLRKRGVNSRV
jgi:hypothetical protein